jgi:hypothetical protein
MDRRRPAADRRADSILAAGAARSRRRRRGARVTMEFARRTVDERRRRVWERGTGPRRAGYDAGLRRRRRRRAAYGTFSSTRRRTSRRCSGACSRRCPSGSMTLVGDFGQASRAARSRTGTTFRQSTFGYRPPGHAHRELPTPAETWRSPTGSLRRQHLASNQRDPSAAPARPGGGHRSGGRPGRQAVPRPRAAGGWRHRRVIAPHQMHEALTDTLRDQGAVADSTKRSTPPIAVLSPSTRRARVRPRRGGRAAQLVTPDAAGLRLLYVVLTRARVGGRTQSRSRSTESLSLTR